MPDKVPLNELARVRLHVRGLINEMTDVSGGARDDELYQKFDELILNPATADDLSELDVMDMHDRSDRLARRWLQENPDEEYGIRLTQDARGILQRLHSDIMWDHEFDERDEDNPRRRPAAGEYPPDVSPPSWPAMW